MIRNVAYAFGCLPSIGVRAPGPGCFPEAVTHRGNGYVCPERTAQPLFEGICSFIDNPAARQADGCAALASLDRFSPRTIGSQWASVFTA